MNTSRTPTEPLKTLEEIHTSTSLTWVEIADRLDLSETYIHRVRKGKQKFSRKAVERLNKLYSEIQNTNGPPESVAAAVPLVARDADDGGQQEILKLRATIADLEHQLSEERRVVHEQRGIIRDLSKALAGPKG